MATKTLHDPRTSRAVMRFLRDHNTPCWVAPNGRLYTIDRWTEVDRPGLFQAVVPAPATLRDAYEWMGY